MKTIRLGAATGWSRDKFDAAEDLVEHGNINYLCFDSMSEITMSAAQVSKIEKPNLPGYDPYLESRMTPILKSCHEKGIKIITNSGWLDPVGAAQKVAEIAKKMGLHNLKVAAVSGGILTETIADMGLDFMEHGEPISSCRDKIVSAEVYLGAKGIVEALEAGADIVITTRVGDGCVYLGPLAYEFKWDFSDYDAIAKGMIIGHLMECGAQVSGGYFADPGYKDVPDLHDVGNPIAEVTEDQIFITKNPHKGGVVSTETCKEQLLYEIQDPSRYYLPDVVADLTKVAFKQVEKDKVEVIIDDGAGLPETDTYKALIGLKEGYMAEEMAVFAGPGAMERAELTKTILNESFKKLNLNASEIRMDYLGLNAIHRESSPASGHIPYEVILRVAIKTETKDEAEKLRIAIDPLAVNGPAGTGKWGSIGGSRVRPIIGLNSALVPKKDVPYEVTIIDLKSTITQ